MELRRVQVTGGSSYIITLPKAWVREANIQKNDPVGLIARSDGTLVITPTISGEQRQLHSTIATDDIEDPKYLFRLLVGAYIGGHSSIEVTAKRRILPPLREAVRHFVRDAIGPEVVDETDARIIIKDLLNPTEMPFDKTVKRMHILVRNMHTDAMAAIVDKDTPIPTDMQERDREVDRLHWLLEHQYHIVSREAHLLNRMGISQSEAGFYYLVGRVLERIGDHAVRISKHAPVLRETDAKDVKKDMATASTAALEVFQNAVAAWFTKDMALANRTIDAVDLAVDRCRAISGAIHKRDDLPALSAAYVVESVRRTGEYSGDIAELVINHLITS